MSVRQTIEDRLAAHFQPERLAVIDESHHHAGHQPGFDGSGESHLRVRIVAKAFAGLSRVARHRAINDLVKPELDAGLHALAVEAAAPGEPTRW
ncbi:BolA protein [Rhizobium sp. RU20A]|uniref:BolA family protein n=1 Tax=Rhizobium sp. RU20A TaxID=1907412 RepID=UPI000954C2A3|nr:BolA family transcriptional regulator [Rhizobium sp. RU20A]SIQ35752.1 BolA protein [Rhizobium sp. RU20A]